MASPKAPLKTAAARQRRGGLRAPPSPGRCSGDVPGRPAPSCSSVAPQLSPTARRNAADATTAAAAEEKAGSVCRMTAGWAVAGYKHLGLFAVLGLSFGGPVFQGCLKSSKSANAGVCRWLGWWGERAGRRRHMPPSCTYVGARRLHKTRACAATLAASCPLLGHTSPDHDLGLHPIATTIGRGQTSMQALLVVCRMTSRQCMYMSAQASFSCLQHCTKERESGPPVCSLATCSMRHHPPPVLLHSGELFRLPSWQPQGHGGPAQHLFLRTLGSPCRRRLSSSPLSSLNVRVERRTGAASPPAVGRLLSPLGSMGLSAQGGRIRVDMGAATWGLQVSIDASCSRTCSTARPWCARMLCPRRACSASILLLSGAALSSCKNTAGRGFALLGGQRLVVGFLVN